MRPSTRIAIAMAAAAVGVVAYWAWFGGEGPSTPTEERGASEAGAAKDGAHAIEGTADSRGDDGVAAERTSDVAPAPKRPPRDLPVTWVEGAITLREQEYPLPPWPNDQAPEPLMRAVDPARLNGSFVPELIDGPDDEDESATDPDCVPASDPRRVRVAHGRFRFDSHGATVMLMEALVLDGRPAKVDGGVELSTDDPAHVAAHWIDDVELHVVDAETREQLREVAVVGRPYAFDVHPGRIRKSEFVLEHQASPFHLTCRTSNDRVMVQSNVWIGAPDHAWKRVRLDFRVRAPQTVDLEEGARLVVEVKGDAERANELAIQRRPRLLLRTVGGRAATVARELREFEPRINDEVTREFQVFDVLPLDEPMEFDGLLPGDYVASLEVGDASARHLVLCRVDVKLAAGATQRVALTIEPDSIVEPVPVEGTLYVPPSWRYPANLALRFTPDGMLGTVAADRCGISVNDMERVRGKEGWYRWRVGPLLPGGYRITADLADFETRIDVGPTGRSDVTLVLPEAAELVVRVVDEQTQEPVAYPRLRWRKARDRTLQFTGVVMLSWDGNAKALVGSVAIGSGGFDADYSARDFLYEVSGLDGTFVVHAGANEIVLTARKRCGVDLRLDADAIAALGGSTRALLEWTSLATGEGRRLTWMGRAAQSSEANGYVDGESNEAPAGFSSGGGHSREFGSNCIVLPAPGRYRFTFPDHSSITPFEVDVPPREFVEYTVRR